MIRLFARIIHLQTFQNCLRVRYRMPFSYHGLRQLLNTVYPKKYAHGFVVLCFVVVMQSFIMNSHEVFIHIHQGCFAGTGAIVRLPQCQWSKPDGYGKISQCITTTKHSKAKTVCIFLGIYCMSYIWPNHFIAHGWMIVWYLRGLILMWLTKPDKLSVSTEIPSSPGPWLVVPLLHISWHVAHWIDLIISWLHFHMSSPLQWRHNGVMASQITSITIVYSTVYSAADQRKHQSSASLAFVRGIHRWPVTQMASNAENVSIWRRRHAKYEWNRVLPCCIPTISWPLIVVSTYF